MKKRFVELGMDISTLSETEALGGVFFDDGKRLPLLDILKKRGVSSIRLRLWNNPSDENGNGYGAGGCGEQSVFALASRVVEAGFNWMLDFHYSDFWADPARQKIPKEWQGLSLEQTEKAVYEYTARVLAECKKRGIYPKYVQIGNEITNGLLWPLGQVLHNAETDTYSGFDNMSRLLLAGTRAARESGDVKIILHLENSCDNKRYRAWFDYVTAAGVDFDIIGVSYYPHWHGTFDALKQNLNDVSCRYKKSIMIVETSYPFTGEHYGAESDDISLVINGEKLLPDGSRPPFPLTVEGQQKYLRRLVELCGEIECFEGLYYWEPAWLAVSGSTWSTEAARRYINEEHKCGGNEWANQCLFDYEGNLLPAFDELEKLRK